MEVKYEDCGTRIIDFTCECGKQHRLSTYAQLRVAPDGMVLRWTPQQREAAIAIVNDIAEDIDNNETRSELRQALAIYADMHCDALQARSSEKTEKLMEAMKKLEELLNRSPELLTSRPDRDRA